MTIDEILDIDISDKSVLIIGCPASGKTWLSKKIYKPTHNLIHTDKTIGSGYFMGCYDALTAVQFSEKPTIVEGVLGYRMLRKGAEYASYYPDIVIHLSIPESKMIETYKNERDANKIKYLKQFNETHDKILKEYFGMQNPDFKPLWIDCNNDY